MRIISDFRDYYDVVQAMGQDHSLVYERKRQFADCEGICEVDNRDYTSCIPPRFIEEKWVSVGFCGKCYPVLQIKTAPGHRNPGRAVCHSIEDVDRFIELHFTAKEATTYKTSRWDRRTKGIWDWSAKRANFEEHFAGGGAGSRWGYHGFFEQFRVPVFVVAGEHSTRHRTAVRLNDCLKPYEFYRIFDPYTAFQEIAMYLGGVLGAANPKIPEVSNADMITAKGFDKWSFRKEPGKKRKSVTP